MKTRLTPLLFALFALLTVAVPAHSACDCDILEDVMQTTLENVNKNAQKQVDAMIKKPDLSSVTDCLALVRAGLQGSFTLGLPDISSILQGICNAVLDMVYDYAMGVINDAVLEITGDATWLDYFGIDWGGSFGLTTNDGNSLFTIDADMFQFNITETDVDVSGAIQDLFN
jgi:hypothetical protein